MPSPCDIPGAGAFAPIRRCVVVASWLLGSVDVAAQARTPVISAVDLTVGAPPTVVTIAGREHLVHELHITNFRPSTITLTRVDVVDADRETTIAALSGDALVRQIARPGAPRDLADKRVIAPGLRVIVYFWLPLEMGRPRPSRLRHAVALDVDRADERVSTLVTAAESEVRRERPLVLGAPLRGGPWVALYDPSLMGGHRTAIYAVSGRARIPARFAVDFVRLREDGTHAQGNGNAIAGWHGYGADVLAVSDAIVVDVKDDMAESASLEDSRSPIPLDNASGNSVTLDLSDGRYAFYEHLKHGSIRVKVGDRVSAGDVIALLGNSGSSSSGPHLHFHVADHREEFLGEGVPFAFNGFEAVGAYQNVNAFATGGRWQPLPPDARGMRRAELPMPNSVIVFAEQPSVPSAQRGATMALDGKALTLTYDSGVIVRGRYTADAVAWEALRGPARGSRGIERTHVSQISPYRFFVNWVESSGTTVSQVLDLDTRQVWSFVTFSADGQRQGMLDRGTITIEDGRP